MKPKSVTTQMKALDEPRKKVQKKFWGSNRIQTHDLCNTGAMLYWLSHEASLEAGQVRVVAAKLLHNWLWGSLPLELFNCNAIMIFIIHTSTSLTKTLYTNGTNGYSTFRFSWIVTQAVSICVSAVWCAPISLVKGDSSPAWKSK